MPVIQKDPTFSHYFSSRQAASVFSLLLTILNPIPQPLESSFEAFSTSLGTRLDAAGVNRSQYLLYSTQSFHCTVATLHHYSSPTPHHPNTVTNAWGSQLENFIQSSTWSSSHTRYLRVTGVNVFPDGVVVLRYEDHDKLISALRKWLADMRTGNHGTNDNSTNLLYVGIPSIYHSTVLRWRETPTAGHSGLSTEQLQSLADAAFRESFEPGLMVPVREISVVREYLPYMQEWKRCKTVTIGSGLV